MYESKAERVAANGRPLGRGGVARDERFSPSTRVGCSRTGPERECLLSIRSAFGPAKAGHSVRFSAGSAVSALIVVVVRCLNL